MSNDTILSGIEPEVAEQIATRRGALRSFGLAAAAASFPVAFAAGARKAFAQDGGGLPQQVVDVLTFALTLEQLENAYYEQALQADGLIPDDTREVFETIQGHEAEHVSFLEEALGDKAGKAPKLDFTAGGKFQPFKNYDQFLLLSQAFEDTGQRAYRGQAPELVAAPDVLTQALTIHSVEARHAARVRRLRELTAWIPREQPDVPAAVKPTYAGMGQTKKYGVDVPQVSTVDPVQVTEAFDEPLTKQEVLKIVKPFLA
ncbi:MAG TPA: ferritin-like domain-containing protein [Solirubrobacteraceae bacterium]|nr:ferritin-like domain-containing protein [Solirubrobacteraceae bacterium]